MKINNKSLQAKLDTGVCVNVMSLRVYNKIRNNGTLHAYGGEVLHPHSKADFKCVVDNIAKNLIFFFNVVKSNSETLLGIHACQDLGLVTFRRAVHKLRLSDEPTQIY